MNPRRMGRIQAVTEAIAGEAIRLDGLASQLAQVNGFVGATGDAAAQTEAAGACTAFAQAVSGALGGFADAEASLATAVAMAAECYALADELAMPE
jgi:hypothetical protein